MTFEVCVSRELYELVVAVPFSDVFSLVVVLMLFVVVVIISDVVLVISEVVVVVVVVVVDTGATQVAFEIFPFPFAIFMVKLNLFPVEGDIKETAKFGALQSVQAAVESERTFPLILIVNLQLNSFDPVLTGAVKLSTWTAVS